MKGTMLNESGANFKKIRFTNPEGKSLAARLDMPMDGKPLAYAIFAHCFACSKNLKAVVHINRALAVHGFAVLRFDFTGLGESEGDFAETNFTTNVEDLVAAADFLKTNFEAPKLLIGHSLGGAEVLRSAGRIPSCTAVATIAAPADLSNLAQFMLRETKGIQEKGEGEITIGKKTLRLRKQFLQDLEKVRIRKYLEDLKRPLLIFHSPNDRDVPIQNAELIFAMAKQPKNFISLDHADHLLSRREDSLYTGSVLSAWAARYIHSL